MISSFCPYFHYRGNQKNSTDGTNVRTVPTQEYQSGNAVNTAMAPTKEELYRCDINVRTAPTQEYQSGNVVNTTIAPTQEYQSGNVSNDTIAPTQEY